MPAAFGITSTVKDKRLVILFAALLVAPRPAGSAGGPDGLELKYVVIVSRHGVRSPTWDNARLNAYSAEPWPDWGVLPGNLTPHGRKLIQIMGAYYHEWLTRDGLLRSDGCDDAGRIHIRADRDERTLETGRAFAESLLAGRCRIDVQAETDGKADPLFSGAGTPDSDRALEAVRERLGENPQQLIGRYQAALDTLESIVRIKKEAAARVGVAPKGRWIELTGPFALGSTFSENLLLEYVDGMEGPDLGWGRLTREGLYRVLEIHALYADFMRRTPYLARARGSNLLSHILRSLEQAAAGRSVPGALGRPGDLLLVLVGHDTNLSNLSGMLGLSWNLTGYQPDDTPPGGAMIFSLWRERSSGQYSLRLRYVAQTLEQMRNSEPLSLTMPPEGQDLTLPGCNGTGCAWQVARQSLQRAIDPDFVGAGASERPTSR